MYNNILLIPSLNPDRSLIDYVEKLTSAGFHRIVIVDDGSRDELKWIFTTLKEEYDCSLITHEVNCGKGKALKRGFAFIEEEYGACADYHGVITADSDGQHTVTDVIKLNDLLDRAIEPTLFLGSRNFDLDIVPQKSKKGNKITSRVFKLLYGKYIGDTQTGLRAISREYAKEYSTLSGDRFEYEMNMLIYATRQRHNIVEESIETVYINNNSETHFRPFVDSVKIYRLILGGFFKYIISSVSSVLLDQGLANLFYFVILHEPFSSKALARIISAVFNFTMNRKLVFESKGKVGAEAVRYLILCVLQLIVSATSVWALTTMFSSVKWVFAVFSLLVDAVLALISFRIQSAWVFKK